jgi:hypothetical protein
LLPAALLSPQLHAGCQTEAQQESEYPASSSIKGQTNLCALPVTRKSTNTAHDFDCLAKFMQIARQGFSKRHDVLQAHQQQTINIV